MMEENELLVQAAQAGDVTARNKIMDGFRRKIEQCARKYYITGGDQSDLEQEGYIGLSQAIEHYDVSKGGFSAFAAVCINNSIKNSIKRSQTQKNRALNDSVPFDAAGEESLRTDSPEELYLQKEKADMLRNAIMQALTPLERQTVLLFMQGLDYRAIGTRLQKGSKAVDNALTRARAKLSEALKDKG